MIIHQITNSIGNYNYNAFVYTDAFFAQHFHGNYELIYCMDGNTEISVNGRPDLLEKGEMILISPYTVHTTTISKDAKTWIGVFSEDHVSLFDKNNGYTRYSKFRCSADIESFLNEYLFFQGTPEQYMLSSCLYMVCSECVKNAVRENSYHSNEFVYQAIDYISAHLNEDISLKALADKLNYEYHYYSMLFNRCFGINFKTFLNIFRFDSACKMLADRDIPITDVCDKCGFGSIRNFNRVFKKLSGLTPGEYRKLSVYNITKL